MSVIDLKNVTIKVKDGTGTPNTFTIKLVNGAFTWSEKYPVDIVKDRKTLSTMRDGEEEPMEVSFTGQFEYYTASTGSMTLRDALRGEGEAADWVSTNTDTCAPYVVNLELENIPSCSGDQKETLTFPKFRATQIDFNPEASSVTVSGMCLATKPTAVRADQA